MRREWLEKDYYAVLGVPKDASDKEIRRAYRKLAQEFHPDSNPDNGAAEDRFKEINEANAVLGDPETRQQYDETREMGPFMGGPSGTTHIRIEDLGDLFGGGGGGGGGFLGGLGDILGGGRARRGPQRGTDVTTDVSLTFHEALAGTTKTVSQNGRSTKVRIPAGVNHLTKIRVRGKGGPGANGGPAGDLFVRVHVAEHPIFKRDGADLRITVPITFTEAALGSEIDVPTLDGKVTLRVPAGSATGKTLRVRERGAAKPGGGHGDLLVTIEVDVPDDVSDDEAGLLRQLRELEQRRRSPRAHLGV